MLESITLSTIIGSKPEEIYYAWLNTERLSKFTGSRAVVDPVIGGKFTAWDDYISGTNLELEPHSRILQSWRTTEFPADAEYSLLEVLLEEATDGTKITLNHSSIPEGQSESYKKGWEEFYFQPMKAYFESLKK